MFFSSNDYFRFTPLYGFKKRFFKNKKIKSQGVETRDAAKYLSTIFNANIKPKVIITSNQIKKYPVYKKIYIPRTPDPIHEQLNSLLDLENGYATFICALTSIGSQIFGHFFIIYKENNTIYYYNQSGYATPTKDVYDITDKEGFIGFFMYYNESKESCKLIKDKLSATVPIG